MLDYKKTGTFLASKRKQAQMTQADVAQKLGVSFQAVSKWENGTLPNVELLSDLARLFGITVDEILAGEEKTEASYSYSKAGVDISYTDAMKREMPQFLKTEDR